MDILDLGRAGRSIRILLDLSAGATNPKELARLLDLKHVEVLKLERLHAKVYLSDSGVVVGSANASANGLGSEGTEASRWHELSLLTEDQRIIDESRNWFGQKWAGGSSVTDSDLKMAQSRWEERQKLRPREAAAAVDVLEAAMHSPDSMKGRGIFVVVSVDELDDLGTRHSKRHQEETGHVAHGWQRWPDMPKDAYLICFTDFSSKGLAWDEHRVYLSPKQAWKFRSLRLVHPSVLPDGYKVGRLSMWRPLLQCAKQQVGERNWKKRGGLCMDLGEFVEKYGPRSFT